MSARVFKNREEAGRVLAAAVSRYAGRPDVVVLALPRGGVPVGFEVARALGAPLDVFVVRKLGVPGYEELAMGAVATGGVRVLNDDVVSSLRIPEYVIDSVADRETQELARRERAYRGGRLPPDLRHKTAILVDDGLATGATMHAAVEALRKLGPAAIVVAVPTAARDTCESLRTEADDVVCATTPEPFEAVGRWYEDFTQTTDEEVRELLSRARPGSGAFGSADAAAVAGVPHAGMRVTKSPLGSNEDGDLAAAIREAAIPLTGDRRDYDGLIDLVADRRFVLLGEASHGTHEFYRERAKITQRLIEEKGFTAVAWEADWPDAYRVDCYVRGRGGDLDADEALADFRRFPTWMWRNAEVIEFVEWLRAHNAELEPAARVGVYGLDLYSLRTSMKAVLRYLEKMDPDAAARARVRYACFDRFGDEQVYGLVTHTGVTKSCEEQVVAQLVELQRRVTEYARRDGRVVEDEAFYAEQNARVVKNAEAYYRSMFLEEVSSWNLRDRHMFDTFDSLLAHLSRRGGTAKVAVWAHNSHIGDARATDMGRRGELNIGQLVAERYGGESMRVGFTTHHGTVTAASEWGAAPERKRVRPALDGSYEKLFHATHLGRFFLAWADDAIADALRSPERLERAIGVIYRPDTERQSHYFRTRLSMQFDAILHFDETRAVHPLERTAEWDAGEVAETFPFGV